MNVFRCETVVLALVMPLVGMALDPPSRSPLALKSSDPALERGFLRLKGEALGFVFGDAPVGPYCEASLPGRQAFCMRDISHQAVGAEVLGFSSANLNMLRAFVRNIAASRRFCTYWEIDREGRPCKADYRDDTCFWYNLPANFDVIDACRRLWRFTGEKAYVEDPEFVKFRDLSFGEYVRAWATTGDGIPDRPVGCRHGMGLASYDEGAFESKLRNGSDLVIIMATALAGEGRTQEADRLRTVLKTQFRTANGRLASGLGFDGKPLTNPQEPVIGKELLYRRFATAAEAGPYLDELERNMERQNVEWFSHTPETLWAYGRRTAAMRALARAMDPELKRRTYPELSFGTIGAVATGLMGIEPDAQAGRIATLCGLPDGDVRRIALESAHMMGGTIGVTHDGGRQTTFANAVGKPVVWRARFRGAVRDIRIDGRSLAVRTETLMPSGEKVSFADVTVASGTHMTAVAVR